MQGTERDRLLRLAAELDVKLGFAEAEKGKGHAEELGVSDSMGAWAFEAMLSDEDDRLVLALRAALARVASGAWNEKEVTVAELEALVPSAIVGALDGAEFVMRGEIMTGGIQRLPALIPSFLYLVTVTIVGQEEAIRYAERAGRLLEASRDELE